MMARLGYESIGIGGKSGVSSWGDVRERTRSSFFLETPLGPSTPLDDGASQVTTDPDFAGLELPNFWPAQNLVDDSS